MAKANIRGVANLYTTGCTLQRPFAATFNINGSYRVRRSNIAGVCCFASLSKQCESGEWNPWLNERRTLAFRACTYLCRPWYSSQATGMEAQYTHTDAMKQLDSRWYDPSIGRFLSHDPAEDGWVAWQSRFCLCNLPNSSKLPG